MSIVQTSAPAVEPVTLTEVEAHLRLDQSSVEPPPSVITVALASPAIAGNVTAGAHRYLATFVTADGETQAGTVSAAVTVADASVNGKVALTAIPLGGASVTSRKLYRTAAGGSTYLLLATLSDNTTTTYTDNIADGSLGAGAPASNTTGDPLLNMLIGAARTHAETACRRAFITQSWKLVLDQFPLPGMNIASANWYGPQWGAQPGPLSAVGPSGKTGYEIFLPLPPLQTVDSIKYYDTDGVLQTLASSAYLVDSVSEPARITPAPDTSWPTTQNRANAIEVTFTCGYGAAVAVPKGIKHWMLIRIGSIYAHREEVALLARGKIEALPFVDGLLDPFRCITF